MTGWAYTVWSMWAALALGGVREARRDWAKGTPGRDIAVTGTLYAVVMAAAALLFALTWPGVPW